MSRDEFAREQARQQALLAALFAPGAALPPGVRDPHGERTRRGLRAYRSHAGHAAERVLRTQCPTVAALVGDEALAGIARACWRARPPTEGDITRFATALPAFIEADPQLAELPWLADVARLELALCAAESAADAQEALHTLAQLGERGPAALRLRLAPGSALLRSRFPAVSIWLAHHGGSLDLQGAAAENAWVWREGWKARVQAADAPTADFVDACLKGAPLDQALAAAGPGFDFEHWLLVALRRRQLLGATAS